MTSKPQQAAEGNLEQAFKAAQTKQSRRTNFRERASAPERLDRMLLVTPAREWIALLAILLMATAVGLWSVLGEVATYVEAHGFLLHRGGNVVEATTTGQGWLSSIAVDVGDEVDKDDVVASITNADLTVRRTNVLTLIDERTAALEVLKTDIKEESSIVAANDLQRRAQLDELEATANQLLEDARVNLENIRQLFEQKIVTRSGLYSAEQEFNEARRVLLELNRDRGRLEAEEITYRNNNAARIRDMTAQVEAARRQAGELEALMAAQNVLAPVAGQVIEVKAAIGAAVNPGVAVVSIRTGEDELELLLYVPPVDGKMVTAGMEALVSPATVRREEFGAIRGRVESLSPFPVSLEGIVAVLQNPSLARTFSEDGAPYAGRIALLPDPATVSGFAWTSPKATNQSLTAGTLASVEIKTRSQAPITLAVPLLKDLLGLR